MVTCSDNQTALDLYLLLFCNSFSGHPWICENGVAPDRALDPAVLSRLKQFSAMNKLKKMALKVSDFVPKPFIFHVLCFSFHGIVCVVFVLGSSGYS